MRWHKNGLVWAAKDMPAWARNSALTPTPFLLNEAVVRVYAGFRDADGVSRIGYVDLDANDPTHVLGVSDTPALDVGRAGCFDDNGVILGHVVRVKDEIRMYYVGFQQVRRAKFLAFTGLAISTDDGTTFQRYSEAPILDRTDGATMIHALHSVIPTVTGWRAWVARGDEWLFKGETPFPRYEIWQTESPDGKHFSAEATKVISVEGDEYRIGRPSVFERPDGTYGMFYTRGFASSGRYDAGLAYSPDGQNWTRVDADIGLTTGGGEEFDALHLCYPRVFSAAGRQWAVYNGNNMGAEGFGLAELLEW